MDKKIEPKDKLFFNVDSTSNERWLINKKHIVSAGVAFGRASTTRIVLTTGAIIDTHMNIGTIIALTEEVEHKNEPEADK